jgi:cellulose synthase/poly-beta-1,6-N-acetylglucosamine synthase-like glycosyltransferase
MLQARWDHVNRRYSLLTECQSILLDGHFMIEHTARNRSGRFFNFNGTAGIWRKKTIIDAGGWQHDTLTEDLDLSYRAQLRGWQFIYLPDLIVPAELPIEMTAFNSQQFRWAKGSIQTLH